MAEKPLTWGPLTKNNLIAQEPSCASLRRPAAASPKISCRRRRGIVSPRAAGIRTPDLDALTLSLSPGGGVEVDQAGAEALAGDTGGRKLKLALAELLVEKSPDRAAPANARENFAASSAF